MQPTHAPVTEPMVTPARVLRDAAVYLSRHGWVQGSYYDQSASVFTPAACVVGAIAMVCYGGPVEAPAQHFDAPEWVDFEAAVTHLHRCVLNAHGCDSAYSFNDTPGRFKAQVLATLNVAADAWEYGYRPHADYPHEPGTLYGCAGCESECFCTEGFQCVSCALDQVDPWSIPGGGA